MLPLSVEAVKEKQKTGIMGDEKQQGVDWQSLLRRKERPLPKAGCSWAFYIALLIIIAYLVVMFIKYRQTV